MGFLHISTEPVLRKKHLLRKITIYTGITLGIIIIGGIITLLLLPDSFYDGFLKDRIAIAFQKAYPAYTLRISKVHYRVLENRVECDSASLTANDSSFYGSITSMSLNGIGRLSLLRPERIASDILANSVIDFKNVVMDVPKAQYELQCARIRLSVPDSSITIDTLELDPLSDDTQTGEGAKPSCALALFSARSVGWVQIMRDKKIDSNCFLHATIIAKNMTMNVKNILMDLPKSPYMLHCGELRVSVPDSVIEVDSTTINPASDDAKFFAGSSFRKTRFIADIPACKITGANCFAFFLQSMYHAHSVQMYNASLDVLINKDKPTNPHDSIPFMPYKMLGSIKVPLQIDSVKFIDARMRYSERFAIEEQAAVLNADDIQVSIKGIANQTGGATTTFIHVQGDCMKAGKMNVFVEIPLASPSLSMHYYGSTAGMDMTQINSWLVPAEHKRVQTGSLQSSNFDIHVIKGKALGTVQAVYRDLDIAMLDKNKSSAGIFEQITSFMARSFKIRGTNQPDKSGAMKIGTVSYVKKPDDAFFQFAWVALRGGICDIVGANF